MKLILAMIVACLISNTAAAQENLSKEQTFAKISWALNDIRLTFPNQSAIQNSSASFVQEKIDLALQKASSLQEQLKSNPFVRVKGFSVGFPSGLTVDFEFLSPSG